MSWLGIAHRVSIPHPMQSLSHSLEAETRSGFPCGIAYRDDSSLRGALEDERVLAVIRFGAATGVHPDDPRQISVDLTPLDKSGALEVWRASETPVVGQVDDIGYCRTSDLLLVSIVVPETDSTSLDTLTHAIYRRLFAFLRAQGYPRILRVWNYFPAINEIAGDMERYRAFCQGRFRALAERSADFEQGLPAASAIGTPAGGLLVYCLASTQAGLPVENPRQVSAFRYPPQYGPKSPSFSRSMLRVWSATHRQLYISGTASIVGHATRHDHDLAAQWEETLNNLAALLANADRRVPTPFALGALKVYLRHDFPLEPLRERIVERFGAAIPTLFLRGDICRSDLLIEVEGLAESVDAEGVHAIA